MSGECQSGYPAAVRELGLADGWSEAGVFHASHQGPASDKNAFAAPVACGNVVHFAQTIGLANRPSATAIAFSTSTALEAGREMCPSVLSRRRRTDHGPLLQRGMGNKNPIREFWRFSCMPADWGTISQSRFHARQAAATLLKLVED